MNVTVSRHKSIRRDHIKRKSKNHSKKENVQKFKCFLEVEDGDWSSWSLVGGGGE